MPVVKSTPRKLNPLARLMRAGTKGDDDLTGWSIGGNQVIGDCLDFKDIRTIEQMPFSNSRALCQLYLPL